MLIKSDPRESHRPAEAVRIALGLISGQHQVSIILMGKAALLLSDDAPDLVDGEELEKYMPAFSDLDQVFYIEQEALETAKKEAGMGDCECRIQAVSKAEISKLILKSDRQLVF